MTAAELIADAIRHINEMPLSSPGHRRGRPSSLRDRDQGRDRKRRTDGILR